MKMFINGELRDFKLVRAGLSRTFDDFVTIISADGTDFSKEVREIAEKIDLRTDLVKTNDHKSFMEVLGTSVLTHKAIIIVVNGKDKGIMFHEEKPVTSTDIRRIPYARGLIDKAVLLCSTNSINSNFERAFRFSKVGSYHEITGKGSKKLGEVLAWLKKVKEEGHTFNMPRNLYKMRSSHLGRKPIKKL